MTHVIIRYPLYVWFLAGCCLIAAVQCWYVSSRGWNPTALLQAGSDAAALPRLERELGPVVRARGLGHDGKYSYFMARDPWFWRADKVTLTDLNDPAYRYGRPLYPVLAGLGGVLPPSRVLFGLIVVPVLAGGLLFVATALLARANGLPSLAALIGLANPGIYSSAIMLTSDLLAFALALTALHCWQSGRKGSSIALFAASVLAKEYYALMPFALACSLARQRWPAALTIGILPLVPWAAWKLTVYAVLGSGEGEANFGWPFEGIVTAARHWQEEDIAVGGFAILLLFLCVAGAVWGSIALLRWQCLTWSCLGIFASRLVWGQPVDLLRVLAPMWWCVVWCWFLSDKAAIDPASRTYLRVAIE
jgi:hypothetical protein